MDFGLWPGYTRINLLKVANGSQCLVPHCVIKTTFSTMQIRLVEVCVIHPQCCLNLLASCHVCPSSLLIGVFIQPRPIFCHSLGCVEVELWYVLTYFHHVFYRTAQKGTLFISFLMFIEKWLVFEGGKLQTNWMLPFQFGITTSFGKVWQQKHVSGRAPLITTHFKKQYMWRGES